MSTEARDFAIAAHGGQTYGDQPYVVHLDAVASVGRWFAHYLTPDQFATIYDALFLHDTLEDTPTTYTKLAERFGLLTAEVVAFVTDAPGKNRKERHEHTYPALASNRLAVFVKLCDRIANVEASAKDAGRLAMYNKEHPYFMKTLYDEGEYEYMWARLAEALKGALPLTGEE